MKRPRDTQPTVTLPSGVVVPISCTNAYRRVVGEQKDPAPRLISKAVVLYQKQTMMDRRT